MKEESPMEVLYRFTSIRQELEALERMVQNGHGWEPKGICGTWPGGTRGTNEPEFARMQHEEMLVQRLEEKQQEFRRAQVIFNALLEKADGDERAILLYCYGMGLSDPKTAELLRCDVKTVLRKRHACLKKLEGRLAG